MLLSRLDLKDKAIMSFLAIEPNPSQETIAREVGLSQSSVASRMKKLRREGTLKTINGLDPLKMGLQVTKGEIATTAAEEILCMFSKCGGEQEGDDPFLSTEHKPQPGGAAEDDPFPWWSCWARWRAVS